MSNWYTGKCIGGSQHGKTWFNDAPCFRIAVGVNIVVGTRTDASLPCEEYIFEPFIYDGNHPLISRDGQIVGVWRLSTENSCKHN
jgi:hypothetical protein